MSEEPSAGVTHEELEALIDGWEDEIAQSRMRARNGNFGMKDEYRLKGKALGLNIARTELMGVLNNDE